MRFTFVMTLQQTGTINFVVVLFAFEKHVTGEIRPRTQLSHCLYEKCMKNATSKLIA